MEAVCSIQDSCLSRGEVKNIIEDIPALMKTAVKEDGSLLFSGFASSTPVAKTPARGEPAYRGEHNAAAPQGRCFPVVPQVQGCAQRGVRRAAGLRKIRSSGCPPGIGEGGQVSRRGKGQDQAPARAFSMAAFAGPYLSERRMRTSSGSLPMRSASVLWIRSASLTAMASLQPDEMMPETYSI